MKRKYFLIIASILILIAAFLRLYKLDGFITFLGDQGRDATIVYRILTLEHFPAIGAPSSVGQIYLGPFYYYLIAPWLLVFNFNPVGLGYGVAFMSIAGVIASYWIIKNKINDTIALIFLAITTFSFTLINLSRFSWNPNLLPIFSFLTLYFFHEWIHKKKTIYAVIFGSLLGLTVQLHHLALLLFIPLFIMYLYHIYASIEKKKILLQVFAAVGAFVFFSIPLLIFDLRHQFLNTKSFIKLFTEGGVVAEGSYIERLQATVEGFLTFSLQTPENLPFSILIFLCIILLFAWIIQKTRSPFLALHALTFTIFILGFALLSSPRHYHYYGPVYMSFYLMVSAGVLLFTSHLLKYATALLLIAATIAINIPAYYFFYYPPNNQIEHARTVADSFKPYIKNQPIQIVALPTTETDGHYRYFLELEGYEVMPHDSPEQAQELYVICFDKGCKPLDDPQWQIAAFYNKAIATSWRSDRATIYKVIHKK